MEDTKKEEKVEEITPSTPEISKAEAPVAPIPVSKEEKRDEKKPATEAKMDKEIPTKFKKIVEEIETMSVLELNELVKVFEDKFGVSATVVATAGPATAGPVEEEKSTANVELTDSGTNKIAIIKVVKEVLGLGLKESKDLVDAAPSMLKSDMKKEEAQALKKQIEEAGGKVTLK